MSVDLLDPEFLRKLEYLALAAKRIHRGRSRGEHVNYRKGSSLEFFDYRGYRPGDDVRYIDWHLYRRLDRLYLKLFSAEEDLTVHLMTDTSASMGFGDPSKLDYARKLGAALGYVAVSNLDRVGAVSFSETIGATLSPMRMRAMMSLFDFFGRLSPSGKTGFNRSLLSYAAMTRNSGLAVIVTDLRDPAGYREGLLALKYRGFDIVLIHLLSEEEIDPPISGYVRLTDSESGEVLKLNVDRRMVEAYRSRLDESFLLIEEFALSHGIEYLRASTSIPFEDLIMKYLRQGMYLH